MKSSKARAESQPAKPAGPPGGEQPSSPARLKLAAVFAHRWALPVCAFFFALSVNVLHIADAGWGRELLPAFAQSDAFYYLHKAWFAAFVDAGGGELAHVIPLSPYSTLVSWCYRAFGDFPAVPFVVNGTLTATAACFAALTTRRVFGNVAGWIAAGLVGLYGPIVFFAGLTVKTSLEIALLAVSMYCAVRGLRGSIAWLAPSAASGALLMVERNNMGVLLAALFFVALTMLPGRRNKAIGATLVLVAAVVMAAGVSWQPSTLEQRFFSPVGLNIHVGNAPGSRGAYTHIKDIRNDLVGHHTSAVTVAEKAAGRALTRSEVSAYWFNRTLRFIEDHPGEFALLQWRKLQLLASHHAPGAPEEYRVWRMDRPALIAAFVDYGLMLSLFVVGVWACRSRFNDPSVRFLLLTLGMYAASLWVFFVIERYRVPMAILMAPFAAVGLEHLASAARVRNFRPAAVAIGGYCVAMLLSAAIASQPGWVDDIEAARTYEHKRLDALAVSFVTKEAVASQPSWEHWAALSRDLFVRRLRTDSFAAIERAIATAPDEPEVYWVVFSLATRVKDDAKLAELRNRAAAQAARLPPERRRRFIDLYEEIDRRLHIRSAGS